MQGSRTRRIVLGVIASIALFLSGTATGITPAAAAPASPQAASDTGNPLLPGNHPDPTIKVFGDAYYLYNTVGDRQFRAYKSYDMSNWVDMGVILDTNKVSWATGPEAWAPDMVERNGKYYFYSAIGLQISVAVCTTPVGPCVDKGTPLIPASSTIQAIDPQVFVDGNQAYLYYGGVGHNGVVKLNADMTSTSGAVQQNAIPSYTEAPFVFKRGSTYYMHYSFGYWFNSSYQVNYATASSPMGPWTYRGQILSSENGFDGPGHDSVMQYPGTDDWYVVYHRYQDGCNVYCDRYAAIQRMYFNADGTIQRVKLDDVGVAKRLAPAATGTPIAGPGGKCVDAAGDDTASNGAAVQLWDCVGGAKDQKYVWNGQTLRTMGKCVGPVGGGTGNGNALDLWDCNGSGGQNWQAQPDGTIRNPQSGRCMDARGGATGNGTRLQLWDCNGAAAQQFHTT